MSGALVATVTLIKISSKLNMWKWYFQNFRNKWGKIKILNHTV